MADVHLPQLGETVTEGTITEWFVSVGETVVEGEPLYEVSTDKVDSEVPAPFSGTLTEVVAFEGATVDVGALLCRIDPTGATSPSSADGTEAHRGSTDSPGDIAPVEVGGATPHSASQPKGRGGSRSGTELVSPVVRRLLAEKGVDPSRVTGTGMGGRITRADAESFLRDNPGRTEPFGGIRRATARHMVASKATSPHVLTAMEVDYGSVDEARRAHGPAWKAAEGRSLTYLPFIVRAVAEALETPLITSGVRRRVRRRPLVRVLLDRVRDRPAYIGGTAERSKATRRQWLGVEACLRPPQLPSRQNTLLGLSLPLFEIPSVVKPLFRCGLGVELSQRLARHPCEGSRGNLGRGTRFLPAVGCHTSLTWA